MVVIAELKVTASDLLYIISVWNRKDLAVWIGESPAPTSAENKTPVNLFTSHRSKVEGKEIKGYV